MKALISILLIFSFLKSEELYLSAYLYSHHFTKDRDGSDKQFNEKHDMIGFEYINNKNYSLTYNNFINSRDKKTELYGMGYMYEFNEYFGFHPIGGYQKGYCFDGLLQSVECKEGMKDESFFILPKLYYKNEYLKIDFFTNGETVIFSFNIKLYPYED